MSFIKEGVPPAWGPLSGTPVWACVEPSGCLSRCAIFLKTHNVSAKCSRFEYLTNQHFYDFTRFTVLNQMCNILGYETYLLGVGVVY